LQVVGVDQVAEVEFLLEVCEIVPRFAQKVFDLQIPAVGGL